MGRRVLALGLLMAVGCAVATSPRKGEGRAAVFPVASEAGEAQQTAGAPREWLAEQVQLLQPLERAANVAWFEASVTGTDEAFGASVSAQKALDRFLADPARFAQVKAWRERVDEQDALLARQVELLYLRMVGKQVDPELLGRAADLEKSVEQTFNTYRATVGGEPKTANEIEEILRTSTDSEVLRRAWAAQKSVGAVVEPTLRKLVKLRNDIAHRLGHRDYYSLTLATREQDEEALLALFDSLDSLTAAPFFALKRVVDERLAKRLGIAPQELLPWHYQNPFFQEPPAVFDTGLDVLYERQDVLALCRRFYAGMGFEVQDILDRSDLYEKPGKSPHAFATDIDRGDDIRVLANVVPNRYWLTTMVHELGHAVYDKYKEPTLPWMLREVAHPLTTEGIAMMLDRHTGDPQWAEAMGLLDATSRERLMGEARQEQAFSSLLFSRWTQVMLRFERELYRDPDQDLNALWWDLVETYQGLKRPPGRDAPDYASKIHLVLVPVYYHNYMLGEMFAAQVHEAIAQHLGGAPETTVYVAEAGVGEFLRKQVFARGARYSWNELTRLATGRVLSPDAFARRFEQVSSHGMREKPAS